MSRFIRSFVPIVKHTPTHRRLYRVVPVKPPKRLQYEDRKITVTRNPPQQVSRSTVFFSILIGIPAAVTVAIGAPMMLFSIGLDAIAGDTTSICFLIVLALAILGTIFL
mgnify:CR=1 FL=1